MPDRAIEHGLSEHQEARFAGKELRSDATGLSYQRVKPGKRHVFAHRHQEAEEVYVVLSGTGRVKLDDELRDVRPLDAIRVAPGTARAFEAGEQGLTLLACGPKHEGDAEVVKDFWDD